MRARITRLGAVVGAAVLVALLAGCAPHSLAERSYDGMPDGTPAPSEAVAPSGSPTAGGFDLPDPDLGPRVQRADRRGVIALSLWGSSSCPSEPTGMEAVGQDGLVITTHRRDGFLGACTADLAVRTHELRLPTSVATTGSLTVVVDDREFAVPPRR